MIGTASAAARVVDGARAIFAQNECQLPSAIDPKNGSWPI